MERNATMRELFKASKIMCIVDIPAQIHFFAHLTVANLISAESMVSLLQSFTAVLDEFGVSLSRAKRAALCAGEGLIIVCLSNSTHYRQLLTPAIGRSYTKSSFTCWCWRNHQRDPGLCWYDDSNKMVGFTNHQNFKQYNSSRKHRWGESFS